MSLSFQPDVTPILMQQMMPKIQPFMVAVSNYFIGKGYDDPMTMMRYYSAVLDGFRCIFTWILKISLRRK